MDSRARKKIILLVTDRKGNLKPRRNITQDQYQALLHRAGIDVMNVPYFEGGDDDDLDLPF